MKKKIAVIEDDDNYREILTLMLERKGYEVVAVSNGFDLARTEVVTDAPDLIILDIILPLITGPDVIATFREKDFLVGVPIILMSSKDEATIIKTAEKLGAAAWFQKPVSDEVLIDTVEAVMKKKEILKDQK